MKTFIKIYIGFELACATVAVAAFAVGKAVEAVDQIKTRKAIKKIDKSKEPYETTFVDEQKVEAA